MSMVRNGVIGGAAVALAIFGSVWTQARERSSECGDLFFTRGVHVAMRKEFRDESAYYKALVAGARAENVTDEDRETYIKALVTIDEALRTTEIVGRMKHPSNQVEKTCHLSLSFSNLLDELDLGQPSVLGMPVDRTFEIVARFKIRFEDLTGADLAKRIENQRDNWLIAEIDAGEVVETATVAKLTRRAFQITEPDFININYDTSFVFEQDVPKGNFSK